jgi:hypothetical protein
LFINDNRFCTRIGACFRIAAPVLPVGKEELIEAELHGSFHNQSKFSPLYYFRQSQRIWLFYLIGVCGLVKIALPDFDFFKHS